MKQELEPGPFTHSGWAASAASWVVVILAIYILGHIAYLISRFTWL